MSNLKNYLYVLNIFLLTIFLLSMLGLKICVVQMTSLPNKNSNDNSQITMKNSSNITVKTDVPISQIYGKRDIFGLFIEDNTPQQQKDLSMNNIPTLTIPEIQPIETEKSATFIDPLPISLNAIIISTDTDSSVCIIADETDKEVIYHVGDRIKDGIIIKLMRDRIMILRLNGQIETYFLHNDSLDLPKDPIESVSKNNDGIFNIDKNKFLASIPNAGAFLDFFETVPFVDETNTVLGFVVTDKNSSGFSYALGFKQFDLITSIDGIKLDSNKKRLLAYENIITKSSKNGFSFKVEFERDGAIMTNDYQVINSNERFLPKESSSAPKATYELINKQPSERRQTAQQLFVASQTQNSKNNDEVKYLQSDEEKRFLENLAQIREEMLAKSNKNLTPKEN